jgi:hypothetical protein
LQGLKIALTGGTKDRLTEESNVADYLIFRLNNSIHANTWYKLVGLSEPSDCIHTVLKHVAREKKYYLIDQRSNKTIWDSNVMLENQSIFFIIY